MVKRNTSISILLLSLCVIAAHAQRRRPASPAPQLRATRSDTTIKGTTLDVYQVYQPELKPITKPELMPTLPSIVKEPAPQQYDVPQQTLYYSYRSLPLRPLALGKDTGALPPQNYVLLGGGNLSTILAEAGLGGLHGRNWNAAAYGRYVTQDGALEGQMYRGLDLHGTGSYKTETHYLDAGLKVSRNVFGRYGYNHDVLSYDPQDVRMAYSTAAITLSARNRKPGPWETDYHPQLSIGSFDAKQGHETTLDISLPATKYLDSSLSLGLALNANLAWTTIGNVSGTNNLLQLAPALDYRRGSFSGHLGVYPTHSERSGIVLLPDLGLRYKLADNKLAICAGWRAQLIQNTLQQLTKANPFVLPGINDRFQSREDEVSGTLTGAIGNHMSLWAGIAWRQYDKLPVFVTQFAGDGKDFDIFYITDLRALEWNGGIRYSIGETFSLGAEGHWFNFYHQDLFSHPYGEPAVRLKGDASFRIIDGLLMTAYAQVLDKIWGRNTAGQDVEQRGVFDLGATGEYSFASRFSVFLRADNLLGRKNERWLGYPSFGFNIYGGLRFRF